VTPTSLLLTTNTQELIPEFFLPGGDWLVNTLRLPLGVRQSGAAVDDVKIPPWANSEFEGGGGVTKSMATLAVRSKAKRLCCHLFC